ncbi:VOC family protein [Amycolatopsis sp. CA-230715]|uniref:VOC family protein n=1 Tax=Amycolatopsis sp. CA-230715 TaxID=2745196 RepID=UPI001C33D715|nr:VOC family protein [Amycolatopsis sp. CA-230715]QWF84624.1 hypothetical protein HUW46_08075 [Amycolatopsis sp. CA-230715]
MATPFLFHDLRTTDLPASRRFYGELFGWDIKDVPAGDRSVPMLFDTEGGPWGGVTELPPGDERSPQWLPYAAVEDLDAATEKAIALGATVARARTDLPQGSLVVLHDPAGATIVLWQNR